jgi:hypothetical protein
VPPPGPYSGRQPADSAPWLTETGQIYPAQLPPVYTPAPKKQRPPMNPRGRVLLVWTIIGVMLLVTALAAIGALNRDVYGAGAFVGRYLETLAAKDAAEALEMPGVALDDEQMASAGLPANSSDLLLRDEALGELTEIEQLSDEALGDGVHEIRFSYLADGAYAESVFYVKSAGTTFPLIPQWEFHESPLAVVNLAVQHTTSFSVNGFELDTRQAVGDDQEPAFNNIVNLQVFTPSRYDIQIDTELLTSEGKRVLVDEPSQVHEASVAALPTDALLEFVQESVNAHLDDCATQEVLQPTGCPFGVNVEDRVANTPTWSIDEYPEITIEPGEDTWQIPVTDGGASIDVDVQSLFDGSVQSLDDRVPFSMTGHVFVQGDGTVDVQLEAVE